MSHCSMDTGHQLEDSSGTANLDEYEGILDPLLFDWQPEAPQLIWADLESFTSPPSDMRPDTGGSGSSTASPAVGTSCSMPNCELQCNVGQTAAYLIEDRPDDVESGYSVVPDVTHWTQASASVATSSKETRASLEQGTPQPYESCDSKDSPDLRNSRDHPGAAILQLPVSERPAEMQIRTQSTPWTRTHSVDRQTRQAILLRFATQRTTLERADLYRGTDLSNLTIDGVQIKGKTKFANIKSHIGDKPAYSVTWEGMSCQQMTETGALCSALPTFLALYHLNRTQPLLQITSVCTNHLGEKHDWLINCFYCPRRQSLDRRAVSVVCRPKKGVWDILTARKVSMQSTRDAQLQEKEQGN